MSLSSGAGLRRVSWWERLSSRSGDKNESCVAENQTFDYFAKVFGQ